MMRTSCSLIDLAHVEHDDGDLGLLERGGGAQRRVEVGALLQMHATTDAGSVDESPQLAAEFDDLIDRVAGRAGEFVDDDPLFAGRLVQQRRLADVRPAEDRDAARAADLVLGDRRDLGQHLHDLVEQVGDTAAVDRRDRVRLAEAEVPQRRGLGLVAGVVDLVGDEEDRLAALAQQLHDVLVGRGRPDHRVDDEQHDVAEVDRDLGLGGDGQVDAAGIGLPAAGVDEREPAIHPLGLVRHAVAGDAGGVLDDRFAAAEDAVHQRGLADVRSPDDRDHRQRREVLDAVLAERHALEQRGILVVELVVGEARPQGLGPLLGEVLVEVGEGLGDLVVAALVLVVSAHRGLPSVWVTTVRTTSRTASTVCSKSRSDESTTATPGAAVRKSTTVGVGGVAAVQRVGDGRGIVAAAAPRCGARRAPRARR